MEFDQANKREMLFDALQKIQMDKLEEIEHDVLETDFLVAISKLVSLDVKTMTAAQNPGSPGLPNNGQIS